MIARYVTYNIWATKDYTKQQAMYILCYQRKSITQVINMVLLPQGLWKPSYSRGLLRVYFLVEILRDSRRWRRSSWLPCFAGCRTMKLWRDKTQRNSYTYVDTYNIVTLQSFLLNKLTTDYCVDNQSQRILAARAVVRYIPRLSSCQSRGAERPSVSPVGPWLSVVTYL